MTKKEKGLMTFLVKEFASRAERKPTAGFTKEMQAEEAGQALAYQHAAEFIKALRDGHRDCPSVEELLNLAEERS